MTDKIVWDQEKFSVGHSLMDNQHKKIVETINELVELSYADFTKADVLKLLDELMLFARQHFGSEEALLRAFKVPYLEEQKVSHMQFYREIKRMSEHCTGHEINEVLGFLMDWWTHHILEEDMQYRYIFAEDWFSI